MYNDDMDPLTMPDQANTMTPGMGMAPGMTPGQQPITDEQKQELQTLIDQIRGSLDGAQGATLSGATDDEDARRSALKEVFMAMKMAGVDLTNPESVAQFITKLKEMNPDLAALFEESVNELLGEQAMPAEEELPVEEPIMNQNPNEALPEELRGPVAAPPNNIG